MQFLQAHCCPNFAKDFFFQLIRKNNVDSRDFVECCFHKSSIIMIISTNCDNFFFVECFNDRGFTLAAM